jgi:hypothetical protein
MRHQAGGRLGAAFLGLFDALRISRPTLLHGGKSSISQFDQSVREDRTVARIGGMQASENYLVGCGGGLLEKTCQLFSEHRLGAAQRDKVHPCKFLERPLLKRGVVDPATIPKPFAERVQRSHVGVHPICEGAYHLDVTLRCRSDIQRQSRAVQEGRKDWHCRGKGLY